MTKQLPGNPYMERLVTDLHERTPESLATLAAAYEQRTANLLTLATRTPDSTEASELLTTVRERLGLTERKDS